MRAALPEDHERVVVAEVVEADAGELGQAGQQGAELRLPAAVRQLEEEAEPLLVDLIGLEHELPDVGAEGVRGVLSLQKNVRHAWNTSWEEFLLGL